jgi:uncharacterized membrane protein
MSRSDPRDFNKIIGHILRYGVALSFVVVAAGTIMLFAEGRTGYGPLGNAQNLSSDRFLIGLIPLTRGVASGQPYAVMGLGLIILFATPVARVFASIFLFLGEKRYVFVAITIIVLTVLLLSTFVIGPILSSYFS